MRHLSVLGRLGMSAAAGIGAGVVAAIIITVIDLYITGHGYGSITREIITWATAGVHLSIGDLVMLVAVIAVAGSTWRLVGHGA
ncbi:MAG TPA: hypothetical protein VGQ54_18555 [Burkholderiales bacterium]|nr:hypothetical protein [Burkholderiales bacterium]